MKKRFGALVPIDPKLYRRGWISATDTRSEQVMRHYNRLEKQGLKKRDIHKKIAGIEQTTVPTIKNLLCLYRKKHPLR